MVEHCCLLSISTWVRALIPMYMYVKCVYVYVHMHMYV